MVVFGIHLGVVIRIEARAVQRGAGKQPPLQNAGRLPFFNAVAPEGSVGAAGIDIIAGIHRDGFDPVQFGGTGECARTTRKDSPLRTKRPHLGRLSADVVDPNLRVLIQAADQQLAALVNGNGQRLLKICDFWPRRAGGRKRNHFFTPPHRAFMRFLGAGAVPPDNPNIPGIIHRQPGRVRAGPSSIFGHGGDVEHVDFSIGKIADIQFAVLHEQTGNYFSTQKSRVSTRAPSALRRPQKAFARSAPEHVFGVGGHGFDRVAKPRFKPVVAGDETAVGGTVFRTPAPGLGVARSE